jgi:hypothetical protein
MDKVAFVVDSNLAPKQRVLYIAGFGRSGSTIIESILNEMPDFSAAGELRYIWERGFIDNRLCGCGKPFHDCEFWGAVIERAYGGFENVDAARLVSASHRFDRTRRMPELIIRQHRPSRPAEFRYYLDHLARLYDAIQQIAGCRVIVDSSKFPSYAAVLALLPTIRLDILHLVRDPRAAAYSWQRRKPQPDSNKSTYMPQHSPLNSSLLWLGWNSISELCWGGKANYLRVRYEDFVRHPRAVIRTIVSLAGAYDSEPLFQDEHTAIVVKNHTVSGNPVRFATGLVDVQLDSEWESRMSFHSRALVEGLTWPLLLHYRYPL